VHPAVDDVELRHREDVGIGATDGAVERELELRGGGPGDRQGDGEHGVGAESPLVRRPVEVDQGPVDLSLVERIDAVECVGDLPVDVVDGLEDALAAEPVPAVSELDRLMDARRGTRGGDGAALRT